MSISNFEIVPCGIFGVSKEGKAFIYSFHSIPSPVLQGEAHYLNLFSKVGFSAEGKYETVPLGNKYEIYSFLSLL